MRSTLAFAPHPGSVRLYFPVQGLFLFHQALRLFSRPNERQLLLDCPFFTSSIGGSRLSIAFDFPGDPLSPSSSALSSGGLSPPPRIPSPRWVAACVSSWVSPGAWMCSSTWGIYVPMFCEMIGGLLYLCHVGPPNAAKACPHTSYAWIYMKSLNTLKDLIAAPQSLSERPGSSSSPAFKAKHVCWVGRFVAPLQGLQRWLRRSRLHLERATWSHYPQEFPKCPPILAVQ